MTNRLFDRSPSNLNSRNSDVRPFNFALKQQLAFSAELEEQLLKLEQRFVSSRCAPCTYDDFGLVEGLELDLSWM